MRLNRRHLKIVSELALAGVLLCSLPGIADSWHHPSPHARGKEFRSSHNHSGPPQRRHRSLDEAIWAVQGSSRGRILDAHVERVGGGQIVYRIKVLMPNGRVRIYQEYP